MVMGVALVCFGLYYLRDRGPGLFFIGIGVLFFIYGISQFVAAKKFRKQLQDKKD
jgi:lipopolysaccharide export LptBFGC system permease protein LptF